MNLCVFTADYGDTDGLGLLRQSCERVGITLRSYGQGKPWPGWAQGKTQGGIEFLSGISEEYAMWVDGHDSLVMSSEEVILRTYQSFSDNVVAVAAEGNCWPDPELAQWYPWTSGKRYVNAGGYMGPTQLLIDELRNVERLTTEDNDQEGWTLRYLEAWPQIQLDHDSRLWRSMSDPDYDNQPSCVRHWNGRSPGRLQYWSKHAAA